MKILHVIDSLSVGGAEILLRETLPLLPEFEHVVCYLKKPDELYKDLSAYPVYFLNHTSKPSLFKTAMRLRRIINREKPSIVHSHLFLSTIVSRIATLFTKTKLVTTIHGQLGEDPFKSSKISLYAERITVSARHHIIGVSEAVLADYSMYVKFSGPRYVLYNFVNAKFFKSNPSNNAQFETLKIISVGNLKPVKNYHFLLKSIRAIKHLPIEIDIYGEGLERQCLQEEIDRYQLPVNLKGAVFNIEEIICDYHCFVTSSYSEGYGIAPMEAMASGVPVLAPETPVFKEVLGECALYFTLTDPESLSELIQKIVLKKIDLLDWSSKVREHALNTAAVGRYQKELTTIYREIMLK